MSWNYRVIKTLERGEQPYYAIHEVYYSKKGKPNGWSSAAGSSRK